MIVLDTTVLVYAVGAEHPLRDPSRRIVELIQDGSLEATTSVFVIQELAHVRARRAGRSDAVDLARHWADLLAPLLGSTAEDLAAGLALYEKLPRLGSFDALLAATAIRAGAEALVSADQAFSDVPGLRHLDPRSSNLGA